MIATPQQFYLCIIVVNMQKGVIGLRKSKIWRNQYFKLVSILSRFWTLYGIFSMIATLQQFYLCIIVLDMLKRSDWTTLKLNLKISIFQTSINFKPLLDVIWHFFYDSNTAAILIMYHCPKHAKRK